MKMIYEQTVYKEFKDWQKAMTRKPSLMNKLSKRLQTKMNSYIPEKIHNALTVAIKQMIRTVLFGAKFLTREPSVDKSLEETEEEVTTLLKNYKRTAAAEGGITGAGGILLGLAD